MLLGVRISPSVVSAARRRYPAEAVTVFQQIFAKRRPSRNPGAAWKGTNSSPARSVADTRSNPRSSVRAPPGRAALGRFAPFNP